MTRQLLNPHINTVLVLYCLGAGRNRSLGFTVATGLGRLLLCKLWSDAGLRGWLLLMNLIALLSLSGGSRGELGFELRHLWSIGGDYGHARHRLNVSRLN
jgi:hypothetical protein